MTKKVVSKKTNKKNHTSQRGITLIALVITIIVMLILVAVTITIAINGGLFGMAKDAKADTEEELAKENVLSTGRVKIDGTWYDSMEDYVNGKESKNQNDDSTGEGSGMLSYQDALNTGNTGENGTLTDNALWTEENGDTAVIPKGFKVVDGIDGDQSIAKGLVIEDAKGNQFVWIPVTYEATGEEDEHGLDQGFLEVFYRSDWSENNRGEKYDNNSYYTEPYSKGEGYPNEAGEYYEMMKSVQKNGGFYIGRYEAGSETPRTSSSAGDTTMVVKRDQYPYTYVAWGKAMNDIESEIDSSGHGAVYLSKHMYEEKDEVKNEEDEEEDKVGVVSTLCYGVQWDAMLEFIKDDTHWVTKGSDYSTTWGNYYNNAWIIDRTEAKFSKRANSELGEWTDIPSEGLTKTDSESYLLTTGASDSFSAKNIYDVTGNYDEWTMEACSTDFRVLRGSYWAYGFEASLRSTTYPSGVGITFSFRPALYIKN